MKKATGLLILISGLTTFAHADVLGTVTSSKAYQEFVANQKYGSKSDYECSSVSEVLKSKSYGSSSAATQYEMVVLNCTRDPHDGMDKIGEKGLAVLNIQANGVEVLSFTSAYYAQPD